MSNMSDTESEFYRKEVDRLRAELNDYATRNGTAREVLSAVIGNSRAREVKMLRAALALAKPRSGKEGKP